MMEAVIIIYCCKNHMDRVIPRSEPLKNFEIRGPIKSLFRPYNVVSRILISFLC